MQMNDGRLQSPILWKVLCAFFIGSVLSSLIFAWCVSRPSLQSFWFRTEEFWIFPTRKLWLLAAGLFFLNLAGSYLIAHVNKWLSFSGYRLIIGVTLVALVPVMVWSIEPLPALAQLLLFKFALALILSVALSVITRRWYSSLAIAMLIVSLTASLIAGVPYVFISSVRTEWFEVSKFFANSSLLSLLSGYWLAKSSARA